MLKHTAIIAALAGALLSSSSALAGNRNGPPAFAGPPKPATQYVVPQATAAESADLIFMREEEKLARDVYLRMHESWGVAPFARIASSEQIHMDAVLRLLTRYRIPDPAAGNLIGEFSNPELQALFDALILRGSESVVAALGVGALIEEVDVEDLAAAIARSDKRDIDLVYENLACGSRNHLKAFAGALEVLTGQPYVAQVLPQTAVDAILAVPVGECSAR